MDLVHGLAYFTAGEIQRFESPQVTPGVGTCVDLVHGLTYPPACDGEGAIHKRPPRQAQARAPALSRVVVPVLHRCKGTWGQDGRKRRRRDGVGGSSCSTKLGRSSAALASGGDLPALHRTNPTPLGLRPAIVDTG